MPKLLFLIFLWPTRGCIFWTIIVFHCFYKQNILNSLFFICFIKKTTSELLLVVLNLAPDGYFECEGTHEAGEQASNQTSRHACNQAGKPASQLACIQTGKHTHEATEQAERKQTSRHAIKQAGKPASKQERLEWARGARPPSRSPPIRYEYSRPSSHDRVLAMPCRPNGRDPDSPGVSLLKTNARSIENRITP